MKVLKCNDEYISYPDGISDVEAFVRYLNENYHSFLKVKRWQEENCRAPYFIESEWEYLYLNIAYIREVTEAEITILSREEYDRRLRQIVAKKCVYCESYEEDCKGDNLKGHREHISLDGDCYFYSKVT